jgi:hypothetical protein
MQNSYYNRGRYEKVNPVAPISFLATDIKQYYCAKLSKTTLSKRDLPLNKLFQLISEISKTDSNIGYIRSGAIISIVYDIPERTARYWNQQYNKRNDIKPKINAFCSTSKSIFHPAIYNYETDIDSDVLNDIKHIRKSNSLSARPISSVETMPRSIKNDINTVEANKSANINKPVDDRITSRDTKVANMSLSTKVATSKSKSIYSNMNNSNMNNSNMRDSNLKYSNMLISGKFGSDIRASGDIRATNDIEAFCNDLINNNIKQIKSISSLNTDKSIKQVQALIINTILKPLIRSRNDMDCGKTIEYFRARIGQYISKIERYL